MKAIYLVIALLLSGFALTPVTAAPAAPVSANVAGSPVILAQAIPYMMNRDRNDRRRHVENRRQSRHYRAGRHYRSAPHGWHRYQHRPRDWRRRGCIVVGPVWFCE